MTMPDTDNPLRTKAGRDEARKPHWRVWLVMVRSAHGAAPCTLKNRMEWEREGFLCCPGDEGHTPLFVDERNATKHALKLEEDFGWHTKVVPYALNGPDTLPLALDLLEEAMGALRLTAEACHGATVADDWVVSRRLPSLGADNKPWFVYHKCVEPHQPNTIGYATFDEAYAEARRLIAAAEAAAKGGE